MRRTAAAAAVYVDSRAFNKAPAQFPESKYPYRGGIGRTMNVNISISKIPTPITISVYAIPEGKIIYHGNREIEDGKPTVNTEMEWFGLNPEELIQYGTIFRFETTNKFYLINMGDVYTLKALYDFAPYFRSDEDLQTLQYYLRINFGYNDECVANYQKNPKTKLLRASDFTSDELVAKYLKDFLTGTGIIGYALFGAKTVGGGYFHPEICVFNPGTVINIEEPHLLPENKMRDKSPPKHKGKTKRPYYSPSADEHIPSRLSFPLDYDNDESPLPINQSLFYGYDSPIATPPKHKGGERSRKFRKSGKRRYRKGGIQSRRCPRTK